MTSNHRLLDTPETAELLAVQVRTLEDWRRKHKGPTFRKVGRLVRYVESDVLQWLDARSFQNTSQYPNSGSAVRGN